MEARCNSRIHFKCDPDGRIEVKCRSKWCGAGNGNVVLHYFNSTTFELEETQTFKEPAKLFDGQVKE